jgi:type I restriction enzyme, S subunit
LGLSYKWNIAKLQDVCKKITDGSHHSPKSAHSGYYMASVKDMTDHDFDLTNCKIISEEDYLKLVANDCKPKVNDVLISKDGNTLLKYVFVNKHERELVVLSSIAILRPNTNILNPFYLKYFLSDPRTKQLLLRGYSSGSALPRIVLKDFKQLPIPVPPLSEQEKIASILSSLDNKIELNNAINKNLEEMAQALFKRWFVDFEFPNENGEPYKSSGGEFVESELGLIPKGWEVTKLGETIDIQMGQSPKSEYYNTDGDGMPFHQGVTNFGYRFPSHNTYCTQPLRVAKKGSILISVRAPVGRLNIADCDLIIGRGLGSLNSKIQCNSYLFYLLKQVFAVEDRYGSGTIFNSITKKELEEIKIINPDPSMITKYERVVNKIDKQIEVLSIENFALTNIRDTLLPKLMSGEIRVPVDQN